MYADHFETRLARVRHRFATTLESKIEDMVVSANRMSPSDVGVVQHISESYRCLHGICASDQRSASPPPATLRAPPK